MTKSKDSVKKTQRQLKPVRIEMWFNEKEASVIEKAAAIKGLARKAFCEALTLTGSGQVVSNNAKKAANKATKKVIKKSK